MSKELLKKYKLLFGENSPIPPEHIMKTLVEISNQSESSVEVLLVLNSIAFLKDHHGFEFNPDLLNLKVQKGEFQRRVEYFWKK